MKTDDKQALSPVQKRMIRGVAHGGRATLTFRLSEDERQLIDEAARIAHRQKVEHAAWNPMYIPPHTLGEFVREAALKAAREVLDQEHAGNGGAAGKTASSRKRKRP